MNAWQLIDSGKLPAQKIMEKDAELLQSMQAYPRPVLHFYDWLGKSLTYGYFTKPEELLDLQAAEEFELKMARRPTGGGVIFHLTDLAFSILIPASHPHFSLNSLENYAYINSIISKAIERYTLGTISPHLWKKDDKLDGCAHFCMAKPTQYDLVVDGRKVGGAAQRKTKWGYLHQGSISLALPPWVLLRKVIRDKDVFEYMQKNTFALLGEQTGIEDLLKAREEIREVMQAMWMSYF